MRGLEPKALPQTFGAATALARGGRALRMSGPWLQGGLYLGCKYCLFWRDEVVPHTGSAAPQQQCHPLSVHSGPVGALRIPTECGDAGALE